MAIGSGDWVIVRKGKPVVRKPSLEHAKSFFDMLRFGRGGTDADCTIFGPGHIEWRCGRTRDSAWYEVTGDRRSLAKDRDDAIGEPVDG